MTQLTRAYDAFGKPVVGIKKVPAEDIVKYSSMKTGHVKDNIYSISDMIEKPSPDEIFFALLDTGTLRA